MPRIPADERRELLVRAALRVMANKGVAKATTRAIVAEASMPLASFHYAFRSREEMMRELIDHVVDAEQRVAIHALRPGNNLRDCLRAAASAYLAHIVAAPWREQVLQELLQYCLRTPGLAAVAHEQYDHYNAAAREFLDHAAQSSQSHWTVPLDDVARLLVATTDGATLDYLARGDATAAARVLELAVDAIVSLSASGAGEPVMRPVADAAADAGAAADGRSRPVEVVS